MDENRKRSWWDGLDSPADWTLLPVKKQRSSTEVIDLTLSSPPPEEFVRQRTVAAPKRVDSGAFISRHDPNSNLHLAPRNGQTQLDVVDLTALDGLARGRNPIPPKKAGKPKFYAVARGHNTGIYLDWAAAEMQTKGYRGAMHQSFLTQKEAESFLEAYKRAQPPPAVEAAPKNHSEYHNDDSRMLPAFSQMEPRPRKSSLDVHSLFAEEEELLREMTPEPYYPPDFPNFMDQTQRRIGPPHSSSITGFVSHQTTHGLTHGPAQTGNQEVKVEPQLCAEQKALVELILSRRNVFYTGSAGCGKSTVLKAFVKELKEMGRNVVIIAPTGKAALEINGSTYFTFAGWTPDHFKKPLKKLRQGAHQRFVNKRMNAVDVLIIDEISMMENHAFERLNEVMKEARRSEEAFGGVQMVVTGDFCQLPPVKPFKFCMECGRETREMVEGTVFKCASHGEFLEHDKWAFRSRAWKQCNFAHVNLTTIHRQKDRKFIDILERCRMGKQLTESERELLLNHNCDVQNPVRLFSTREEVRRLNYEEYSKLKTEPRQYKCYDDIKIEESHPHLKWKATRLPDGSLVALKEQKFDTFVELKEGMRVVLQVNLNIEQGLVNGSQGIIVGWEGYDENRLPKADKSRGRGGESMPSPMNAIMGEHAVYRERHIKDFIEKANVKEWPIVEFENGAKRTIFAECIVSELGDTEPYTLMSRTQIPLLAGWAMTVHKSQGMTLNKVEVDLGKAFEEGQVYVALSRARSLDGLKVRSLGRWSGGGNTEVMEFLKEKFGIGI